MGVKLTVNNY